MERQLDPVEMVSQAFCLSLAHCSKPKTLFFLNIHVCIVFKIATVLSNLIPWFLLACLGGVRRLLFYFLNNCHSCSLLGFVHKMPTSRNSPLSGTLT